jgi:XTP/dITP diphosphohydrolase
LPSGEQHVFEGRIDGTLTFPPRGDKGFGYDPIFIPKGYTQTFAEMEPSEKHALSHRARAFEKFVEFLSTSIKPFIGMSG